MPTRNPRAARPEQWRIDSVYERRRDAPKRIERAYRILIEAKMQTQKRRGGAADARGDLREGLHPSSGTGADHRKPACSPEALGG